MISKKRPLLFVLFFLCSLNFTHSQSEKEVIPKGYSDFVFGDSLDLVKEKLKLNSFFSYRGDPDVSMMLEPEKSIIDTKGSGIIKRAFFIFSEEYLYQISLLLNEDLMDFYTMQILFTEKYGEPNSLDPSGMIWEDNQSRISLEYPLTIKYINLEVYEAYLEEKEQNRSIESLIRDQFLETF